MYFFCKKPYLTEVFGYNAIEKQPLFFGKVKLIGIKVKKVFLFKLKI